MKRIIATLVALACCALTLVGVVAAAALHPNKAFANTVCDSGGPIAATGPSGTEYLSANQFGILYENPNANDYTAENFYECVNSYGTETLVDTQYPAAYVCPLNVSGNWLLEVNCASPAYFVSNGTSGIGNYAFGNVCWEDIFGWTGGLRWITLGGIVYPFEDIGKQSRGWWAGNNSPIDPNYYSTAGYCTGDGT
jgi:hypothetical protein